MQRNDYSELYNTIQGSIAPLMVKLNELDAKVDKINENGASRADLEKAISNLVPRDLYNAQREQLVSRDLQLETAIRDLQLAIDKQDTRVDARFREQEDITMSARDRFWVATGAILGGGALTITFLEFALQHIRLF